MNIHEPRKLFRDILAGNRCVTMASVYEPVSARIAQNLGFEAGLMGGSLASLAVLGAPDLTLITLTELADQVRRCTRASGLPLVIDGDHGYGNSLNVMRTVEELDWAGAAAVSIEDTLLPRSFGSSEDPQFLPIEEATGKMRAAVAARSKSGPLILGRTSAATAIGVDDAIERLKAYEAADVDALMVASVRSPEDLDKISAATHLPLVVGGLPASMCDEVYLASRRARLWSSGHQTVNVAVQSMYDAMKAVREGILASKLDGAANAEMMKIVTAGQIYESRLRCFMETGATD